MRIHGKSLGVITVNTTPDKFKTFDLPLEEQMFKDFVNELLPEFCANDMNELTNDIKDAWEVCL